jgi:hypothetical protein
MKGHIVVDRFARSAVACFAALGLVAVALADTGSPAASATITVFDDRYIVGDRAFDDLDYLEKHITTAHVRDIELLICGANATRSLKAVVHRFRHLPVQMRMPDLDELECMSSPPLLTPVRERVGRRPFGIDDAAVDRYWQDLMP